MKQQTDGSRSERLAQRWPTLVAIWVGLGVAIFFLAPHYNDAQRAGDVVEFGSIVDAGTPWRFAMAAILDVGFAMAYGLLGFAIGWRQQRSGEGRTCVLVRRSAGTVVVLGALCDIAENLVVLANIVRRDTLTAGWIEAMRTLGDLKWLLGIGGALVLLVAVVGGGRRSSTR